MEEPLWAFIGVLVFSVGAISDWLDGYLARKHEVVTEFGKFIDPLADKVLTFAGFGILPFLDNQLFPWWAVSLIIFRDVAVTLLRIVAKRKDWPFATSVLAKWKTAVQLVYLYYILLLNIAARIEHPWFDWAHGFMQHTAQFYIFLFVAIFTFWSGVKYFTGIYENLQKEA